MPSEDSPETLDRLRIVPIEITPGSIVVVKSSHATTKTMRPEEPVLSEHSNNVAKEQEPTEK